MTGRIRMVFFASATLGLHREKHEHESHASHTRTTAGDSPNHRVHDVLAAADPEFCVGDRAADQKCSSKYYAV